MHHCDKTVQWKTSLKTLLFQSFARKIMEEIIACGEARTLMKQACWARHAYLHLPPYKTPTAGPQSVHFLTTSKWLRAYDGSSVEHTFPNETGCVTWAYKYSVWGMRILHSQMWLMGYPTKTEGASLKQVVGHILNDSNTGSYPHSLQRPSYFACYS